MAGEGERADGGDRLSNATRGVSRRDVLKTGAFVPLVPVAGLPGSGTAGSASSNLVAGRPIRGQVGSVSAIIDDFEDGDLSEYTESGNGVAEVQSDTVFEGSRAFHATVPTDGSSGGKIQSTSGLANYPSQGDTFSALVKMTTSRTDGFVDFGYQDNANRYEMRMRKRGSTFELHRLSGGARSVLARTSQSWGTGWYEVEFDWGEDGTITITAYEDPGGSRTQVNQISATDTTFADGGIGFHCAGTRGGPRHYYADLAQITSRGSASGSGGLVWETAADWDAAVASSGVVHEAVANTDHVDAGVVKQGYSLASPVPSSGLVGYWPLQEDSGGTAYDFSGNGNHGAVNGATQGATGLLGTTTYSFDGSTDYVNVGTFGLGSDSDFTLSGWYKPNSTGSFDAILSRYDSSEDYIFFGATNIDTFRLRVGHVSNGTEIFINGGERVDGVWYHAVGVYDSSGPEVAIYVNGVLEGSSSGPVTDFAESRDMFLGARNNADGRDLHAHGAIQDVRVYDRVLSSAEVQALYDVATTSGTITTAAKEA